MLMRKQREPILLTQGWARIKRMERKDTKIINLPDRILSLRENVPPYRLDAQVNRESLIWTGKRPWTHNGFTAFFIDRLCE